MEEDVEGHIKPVEGYYSAIKEKVRKGYAGVDDELVEKISAGIDFEKSNATKGLVEYYMGEQKIVKTLDKVGFTDIKVFHHSGEPFYNIVAKKPVK